jgi:hypothetical protein
MEENEKIQLNEVEENEKVQFDEVEVNEKIRIALEQQKAEYEERIEELKLDFELETGLLKAGAKNVTAVAALIDREKVSIGENGELCGLDEQIKALKKSEETAFLFKDEQKRVISAFVPYDGCEAPYDGEGMSYSQFCEIYSN